MQDETGAVETRIMDAIAAATDLSALEDVRVAALGKKGEVSAMLKTLGGMDADDRQRLGPVFNQLKIRVTEAVQSRRATLEAEDMSRRLASETLDMTLPVDTDPQFEGRIHPVSQTMEELSAIFASMGFDVAEGPDIESGFYNFTALNIPEAHPARQMHDTFYLTAEEDGEPLLLRTHTSPCRCAPCRPATRPSGLSRRGAPIGATATRRTRRCFTKSRGWWSMRPRIWGI